MVTFVTWPSSRTDESWNIRVYWHNTNLYIHISLRILLLHPSKYVHFPPERVKETCRIQKKLQGVDGLARSTSRQAPKACQTNGQNSAKILCKIIYDAVGCRSRVLQSVAECCGMIQQRHRVRISVVQCVAVCCSVLQCVAVCCSVLQCVVARHSKDTMRDHLCGSMLLWFAVCCDKTKQRHYEWSSGTNACVLVKHAPAHFALNLL